MRAVLLVLAVAAMAWGAAPPAAWTPEQVELARERNQLWVAAGKAWNAGKQEEGISKFRKALEIESRLDGPWHRNIDELVSELGNMHRDRGEWEKEAECRRAVIEARRRLHGTDHYRTVEARLQLEEALAQQKRTPAQREALRLAYRLNQQVVSLWHKRKFAEALPLAKKALQIRRALAGEKHPDVALSLFNLAAQHEAMGDHKAALPLYKQALEIRKEVLGERHPHYAHSLNQLASYHQKMGNLRAALPLFKQALGIRKEAEGEGHPYYAAGLNNLAWLLQDMGDYKSALPLHVKALAINKEILGDKHPDYATSLNNLASLLHAMGNYKAALPLFQKALAITKAAQGAKHPDHANSLHNLAMLLDDMGDRKEALPLFQRASAIWKEAAGEKHPDYALGLYNLAVRLQVMGDQKAALPLFQKALEIRKEVLGERHPAYAMSLDSLAKLVFSIGDRKVAISLSEKALAIHKEALGEKHPHYARSLGNLAVRLQVMGDQKAALPLFQKALAITEAAQGAKHPDHANSLHNLAVLRMEMGDHKTALPLSEEALAITTAHMRGNAAVQSDRQQLAAADAVRRYLDNRLNVPDLPGHPTAASHVLAWKGTVLLRQQQRRLFLRVSADPTARASAERLQAATRHLAALRLSPKATRDRLEELEKDQEAAQADLARLSEAFREDRDKSRPDAEAMARSLPEGAVLVDYLFYHDRLAAFIHRRGQPAARVDLGPAKAVADAVREWRPLLLGNKPDTATGGLVKRLIWTPLEKHLEGARVVLVSPDGVLGTVPFAALPGKARGTYLIEDVALAVVPVPSVIPDLMQPVPEKDRHAASLVVVGGVDYDSAGAALAAGDRSTPFGVHRGWGDLPGTAAEAKAIAGAFAARFKAKPVALSRGDATKKAVAAGMAKSRYAHLATHGYFAPREVKSALAHDGKKRLGEPEEPTGWHPLLLSGLALSGANREPKAGEEDGILTALEVSEMDLTRLELAVLSACETGLGEVAGGEGILGMQRAFQIAGVRSVVASLWKVDDLATQRLMADFYSLAWDPKNTVSRVEALRRAQLAMLNGRTLDGKPRGVGKDPEKIEKGKGKGGRLPPFYWAAFVLSGDWR